MVNAVEAEIRQWIDRVVIGLNLCPFAARPVRAGALRVHVSNARARLELLTELQLELQRLEDTSSEELETTIVALPDMLADFAEYNDFLDDVDELLETFAWSGDYQVASFHPRYQFADTKPEDAENLTNRAPYPLLHILREDSVEAVLSAYPDADCISERNIRAMRELSLTQRRLLFGFLESGRRAL